MLRGEKNGRIYRLGDSVRVQVIRVDLERRQIDLGLTEILDAVRGSDEDRGPATQQGASRSRTAGAGAAARSSRAGHTAKRPANGRGREP